MRKAGCHVADKLRVLCDLLPKGFILRQRGLISFSECIWNLPQWGKRGGGEASSLWNILPFTVQLSPRALEPLNMPFIHHWSNTFSVELLCYVLVSAFIFVAHHFPITFGIAPEYSVLVIRLSLLLVGEAHLSSFTKREFIITQGKWNWKAIGKDWIFCSSFRGSMEFFITVYLLHTTVSFFSSNQFTQLPQNWHLSITLNWTWLQLDTDLILPLGVFPLTSTLSAN